MQALKSSQIPVTRLAAEEPTISIVPGRVRVVPARPVPRVRRAHADPRLTGARFLSSLQISEEPNRVLEQIANET